MTQALDPDMPEMIEPKRGECPIWPDFSAVKTANEDGSLTVTANRAGGSYNVVPQAVDIVVRLCKESREFQRALTTWMVGQRTDGIWCPEVNSDIVDYASNMRRLSVIERADRLLRYLVEESYEPGQEIRFTDMRPEIGRALGLDEFLHPNSQSERTNLFAYAWSESDDWDAVKALLDYLERRELIAALDTGMEAQGTHVYQVQIEGFAKIEELGNSTASRQAFVAMWFDASMNEIYEKGIHQGIQASGYDPKVINRDPSVDKIDDAIIAEIRRSKFIVADFTQGEDGPRGGVCFEAGFAMGLGIPVIFTCRHDMTDNLHFDTRQYNHIVWTDADDLCQKLLERIRARIT